MWYTSGKMAKIENGKGLKVVVGLSGGVDSAVSATLLKQSGAEVVGAFIKTWSPEWLLRPDGGQACTWKEERREAMRVAAHLDIPFLTIDLEKEYKESVADYMISEYKLGRTPNPDVMCNKEIKFGAFLDKALELGADAIATGHYARIAQISNLKTQSQSYQLLAGKDESKDQSYFLWTLNQRQLSHTIFPVGHIDKSEVRELARQFKLPVANKRDSQGICFLGHVDMREFLSHYIKTKPGQVLDTSGKVVGEHDGAIFYTIGQAWNRPYYVVAKNMKKNTLTVSPRLTEGSDPSVIGDKVIKLKAINWISGTLPNTYQNTCQIRYHGELLPCKLIGHSMSNQLGGVRFERPVLIAPGQSVVLYNKEVCLGGGIVR